MALGAAIADVAAIYDAAKQFAAVDTRRRQGALKMAVAKRDRVPYDRVNESLTTPDFDPGLAEGRATMSLLCDGTYQGLKTGYSNLEENMRRLMKQKAQAVVCNQMLIDLEEQGLRLTYDVAYVPLVHIPDFQI
jgi:hypothetical protein